MGRLANLATRGRVARCVYSVALLAGAGMLQAQTVQLPVPPATSLTLSSPTTYSGTTITAAGNSTTVSIANGANVVFQASGTITLNPGFTAGSSPPGSGTTFQALITGSPGFTISVSPASKSVAPGGSAQYTVTLASVYGFTGSVSLAASGLPSGATASFNPTSVSLAAGGQGSSTLTVTTTGSTPVGTSTITVQGTSGSVSQGATASFVVSSSSTVDFTITVSPPSAPLLFALNQPPGVLAASYTVTLTSLNGFSGSVALTVQNLPGGANLSFSPSQVTVPANSFAQSTMTVTAQVGFLTNTYGFSVVGTSVPLIHSVPASVYVQGFEFTTYPTPPAALTVVAGSSASYTISAVGYNSYSGSITVGATSGNLPPTGITVTPTGSFQVGTTPVQQKVIVNVAPGFTPGTYYFGLTGSPTQADTGVSPYSPTASQVLTVVAPALKATCAGYPNPATVGQPVTYAAYPSGGTPNYTYSWSGAASGTGSTSAFTPSAAQIYTANLTVKDSNNNTASTSCSVTAQAGLAFTSSAQLPSGSIKAAYSQTLAASGGTPPYTWSAPIGSLPGGLTLSTSGVLSGTPTVAATYSFAIYVTDSQGTKINQLFQLTISSSMIIMPTSLPNAIVSTTYPTTNFSATGGTPPYYWTALGLPTGLSLNYNTGVLSGTPSTPGTYPVTVQAEDSATNTATQPYSITIWNSITITPNPLPTAGVGVAINQQLTPSGGAGAPYTSWSLASQPSWLTVTSSGVLQGTPLAAGTYPFTVTVKDSAGDSGPVPLSLTVSPIAITPSSLPNAAIGFNYSETLAASGGTAPYTWSIVSGTLPSWLALDQSKGILGMVAGTNVTAGGPFTFTVQAKDSTGQIGTQQYTLTVGPPSLKEYIRLGGRVIAIENP
jgi:hypothetical protein